MPEQPPNGRPAAFSDPPPDLVGSDFEGRYRVEARLGEGGVGVVYRATDLKLSRPVALKVLHEHAGSRKSSRKRFQREARALAALTHPHVVGIIDFGVADTTPYLVMELLEGATLRELLKHGTPLEPPRAFRILRQILLGLASVHRHGLVHRDLKPANVFLQPLSDGSEHVKLLDFGLAKFLDPDPNGDGHSITRAGEIFGTAGYIAPEQLSGAAIDERADIYAVGVILFEMLAGRKPFGGESHELLRRQLVDPVPALQQACPSRKAVPELESMIRRALEREPAERYQNVAELSAVFETLPSPAVLELDAAAVDGEQAEQVEFAPTLLEAGSELPTRFQPRDSRRFRLAVGNAVRSIWQSIRQRIRRPAIASALAIAVVSTLVIAAAVVGGVLLNNPNREERQAAFENEPAARPGPSEEREGQRSDVGKTTAASGAANRAGFVGDTRPPAVDPWAGRVPKNLAKVHRAVRAGHKMGDRTVAFLRRYNKNRPDDARGHLLLAGLYLNRNWVSDALNQYDLAFSIDPGCRGDPGALRDLLRIVAQKTSASQASELIRKMYGPEALPAVDRALAKYESDPDAVARLRRLRESLVR